DAFSRMWLNFASEMSKAGVSFVPGQSPQAGAQEMRSALFRAMSEYCDQYMRSPQFQETMKQSLNGAIQLRKQFNDFLSNAQHEFMGAGRQDVDQLMLVMRHLEQRMVDGFERISSQVGSLQERVAKIEERDAASGQHAKRPHSDRGGRA